MNQMVKVNMNYPGGTYQYYDYHFPSIGETVNWSFANITGTVTAITWTHTNEVTLTIK